MSEPIIRLTSATKLFKDAKGGKFKALDAIDLTVSRNEFITLLGPSGCGKTTLLNVVGGFVTLDEGTIEIDGVDMTHYPAYRRPVNTVFQNYALFPYLSVAQNISYPLDVKRVGKPSRQYRVSSIMKTVGLDGLETRLPRQLSGGQQQRVALARAIIGHPKVLLLDEPLSALDKNMRHAMQREIKSLQHELGIAFLMVTHDQQEALSLSDRIAILNHGRIQQIGAPQFLYEKPINTFVARFLGAGNLMAGTCSAAGFVLNDGSILYHQCAETHKKNQKFQALLRPECLSLARRTRSDLTLEIVLEHIAFNGASFEILGRHASGSPMTATIASHEQGRLANLHSGKAVRCYYDPSQIHLIAGEDFH